MNITYSSYSTQPNDQMSDCDKISSMKSVKRIIFFSINVGTGEQLNRTPSGCISYSGRFPGKDSTEFQQQWLLVAKCLQVSY